MGISTSFGGFVLARQHSSHCDINDMAEWAKMA